MWNRWVKTRGLMIRRQAPVEWQGRSSDLTASDFCRWGHLTALVYVKKIQRVGHSTHVHFWHRLRLCISRTHRTHSVNTHCCHFPLWFLAYGVFCTTDWDLLVGFCLGAFAELRKAAIGFVLSLCSLVCLSVRMEQLGFHWTYFHEI